MFHFIFLVKSSHLSGFISPHCHMTIFSSIAFAYYFSPRRDIGRFLLAVAWLVAWSRVYVGVHFPVDMAGAFILSWAVNLAGLKLWNHY